MGGVDNVIRGAAGVMTMGASELLYYQPREEGKKAAEAAQFAANATQREAYRQHDEQKKYVDAAISAADSPQELAALDRSLKVQEQHIQRQMKFVEAIDPAVLESSKQVLDLLKGQEASALGPIRQQRQMMRDNLMNSLRSQFGPGAETSSVGQNALQKFDMETNQLMSGAQQQTLNQLMGIAGAGSQIGDLQGAAMGNAQLGAMFGQRAGRIANANFTGADAMFRSGQNVLQSAGAQWVGQQLEAQSNRQLMKDVVGLGAQIGGAALGGAFGGGSIGSKVGASVGRAVDQGIKLDQYGNADFGAYDYGGGSYKNYGGHV